jgi:hypothetical protein
MKALLFKILAVAAMLVSVSAFAQVYPYSTPTYIPNLRAPSFAIASNVANTAVVLNNIGTVSLQLTGTCTSLQGKLEGTVDGTNYSTLNIYALGALSTASAVTSISGVTGTWTANTGGLNQVRFNNTAVSGTACVGTLAGSPTAFSLPH